MNYLVRNMEREDIPHVQHVAKTSWNSTYDGIIPREIQDDFLQVAYNDDRMKKRLAGSYLYVVDVEGEIVGFANFSPVNEEGKAELGAIYLLPEYQGNGMGTALLKKGITELKDIKEIFISVEKDNEIGKRFYEAKGFDVISEFDDSFDGHILKTIRMVLHV
ncbi:GNAT family N-acetyltransferase [Lentibacillus sp. Marseille-P4043]|uniref:GNAT family N-acetyltransferase n=1 Tax=Lentibacillus sp. Marseille-P4043 TaxID=2040293 RepID=UPI000D0BB331|nr:GNAT family N-acetyltransferase [Lentibacillus sp. Marseille-P4043]